MSSTNKKSRSLLAIAGATLAAAGLVSVAAGCSHSASSAPSPSSSSVSIAPPSVAPYTPPPTVTTSTAAAPGKSSAQGHSTSGSGASSAKGSTAAGGGGGGSHASVGHETAAPKGSPKTVYVFNSAGQTIVNAPIIPIFVDASGVLAPPGGVSGYLADNGWALPGYAGAAILAGHVTYNGDADTFFNLTKVVPGNKIIVRYSSGDQVTFVATRSAGKPKSTLSKDGTVWDSSSPTPVLRLITCDPRTPIKNGHFEGNWVVWANLA